MSFFQSLSRVQRFATPWTAACHASLSFIISWSLLKLMSVESMMPSNYLIFCCPLLLLPLIISQHQCLFQWVGSSHQVAKVLEPQLQHQSFWWIFRVDFFRMDWSDLAVQGTLKHSQESSPAPQFKKHQFFGTQCSLESNSHIHTWLLEKP